MYSKIIPCIGNRKKNKEVKLSLQKLFKCIKCKNYLLSECIKLFNGDTNNKYQCSQNYIFYKIKMQQNTKYDCKDTNTIIKILKMQGCCLLKGINNRKDFIDFAKKIGKIIPDSSGQLITDVGKQEGSKKNAFTDKVLDLHTDRAAYPNPPKFLLLWIGKKAVKGGRSSLSDGKKIHEHILKNERDLATMSVRYSAMSQQVPQQQFCVFSQSQGQLMIRVRFDQNGIFQSHEERERLKKIVQDHKCYYELEEGEGYIINNRVMLHGREPYEGERLSHRIMLSQILEQ